MPLTRENWNLLLENIRTSNFPHNSLELNNQEIGEGRCKSLMEALKANRNIKEVTLLNNHLNIGEALLILELLAKHVFIEKLTFSFDYIDEKEAIEFISLLLEVPTYKQYKLAPGQISIELTNHILSDREAEAKARSQRCSKGARDVQLQESLSLLLIDTQEEGPEMRDLSLKSSTKLIVPSLRRESVNSDAGFASERGSVSPTLMSVASTPVFKRKEQSLV